MKRGITNTLARTLGSNDGLNKKALQIKKSWDEVETLLKNVNTSGKLNKPKKK